MIDEKLLNKFDRIQDLPVPEEMLGAYIEGNVDSSEASQIEFAISEDTDLSDLVDGISSKNGSILDNLENQIFDQTYPHFLSDIQLPSLESNLIHENLFEDHMVAVCYPEDFFNGNNSSSTDELFPSDSLLEINLSHDDSFLDTDQSLDIDSHKESDDMFNADSNDI